MCLSVGSQFDEETTVVALSLQSGATCAVESLGFLESSDIPPGIVWIDDALAWPGGFEGNGVVLDLNAGDVTDIGFDEARFFDWAGGVLVDPPSTNNFPFYASVDDLIAGTNSETYALSPVGSRGFTVDDVLHTYDYDGASAGSVNIVTGDGEVAVVLPDFPGGIDGMDRIGDAVAVLVDEVVYIHDLETGAEVDTQPISYDSLRGLACSPGVSN